MFAGAIEIGCTSGSNIPNVFGVAGDSGRVTLAPLGNISKVLVMRQSCS